MKKVLLLLSGLLFLVAGWYLFLKPSDYIIRFKVKAIPGTINQTLKAWNLEQDTYANLEFTSAINQLTQHLKSGDSTHTYRWEFTPLTDSTSQVVVGIKDNNFGNSIKNKVNVLFTKSNFTKTAELKVKDFMAYLKNHTDKIAVKVVGIEELPTTFIAYLPITEAQRHKAGGMMRNYNYLNGELTKNKIQFNGLPMVIVNNWDKATDSIQFDFAQPIIRSERLPTKGEIKYKKFFGKKALKAVYNGNYITSDRAWYALLDYAEKHNINVIPTPIEVFYNNPNMGAGEENWKAEVYLPLKE